MRALLQSGQFLGEQRFSLTIGQLFNFIQDSRFHFFSPCTLRQYLGQKWNANEDRLTVQRQFPHLVKQLENFDQ